MTGALLYGTLKANWALGGDLGVRGEPPWTTRTGNWAEANDLVMLVAFEGTVVLALLAIALLATLVRPSRRLPRRPLAAAAWLGCLLVGGAWIVGTISLIEGTTGPDADSSVTPVAFWVLWASFGMLGGSFGATTWLTRPRVPK